jgi:hypothetical protein
LHIEYHAFAGCPDVAAFVEQVRLRAPFARHARPGETAKRHVVSFWADGARVAGRLELGADDAPAPEASPRLARHVVAETCPEAAAALAFVVALSLEPSHGPPEAPLLTTPRPSLAAPPPPKLEGAMIAGLAAQRAIAPRAAFGPVVGGELGLARAFGRPSLRLTGASLGSGSATLGPGQAEFGLLVGSVAGCMSSSIWTNIRLSPCLGLELGSLRARGAGVDRPVDEARLWGAGKLFGRARVAIVGPLFVELSLGLTAPLTRRRFVFENPATEVFAVPTLAADGALLMGLSIP